MACRLPSLVGEIIVGVLLGPGLADFVPFPYALRLYGELGLLFLVLEAGVEVDIEVSCLANTSQCSWACFCHSPEQRADGMPRFSGVEGPGSTGFGAWSVECIAALRPGHRNGPARAEVRRAGVSGCWLFDGAHVHGRGSDYIEEGRHDQYIPSKWCRR
eukprot:scaffold7222_cov535-Prasinococcus_capsulatus_cf.AAC.1